jgi:hypothetical protein
MVSISRLSIANIDPASDFSINRPLLYTRFRAVLKSMLPEATSAEYSPRECPAMILGVNSVIDKNFL